MILSSQPKQLRLQDDGQILWQADSSNPLPGISVAQIRKGENALKPSIELIECEAIAGQDKDAVAAFIKLWLDQHISTILEKLVGLTKEEGIEGPAKDIALKVYEALGILPRQDIEGLITALTPEARKVLRQRHIRLGPVLVFVPELNKPAAVRLRALLWWLWNDRALPAPVPKDGVVSMVVDEAQIDPVYQRAIGYPVYGGRAIRVDMLDRLICAVYDTSKEGSFKATHTMAEWLGSPIPDLYKVLESMGHKKISDPSDQPKVEILVESPEPAAVVESAAETAVSAAVEVPVIVAPTPVLVVKPELATFRLKRGKANEASQPRAPRPEKQKKIPPPFDKLTEEEMAARKLKYKPKEAPRSNRDHKKPREEKTVFAMEARPEKLGDSPFAMLQQLKVGKKD